MGKRFPLLLLLLSAACGAPGARVGLFAFGSLGEAPYREIFDVMATTPVPQAGLQALWRMKFGGPFAEASMGRYYGGGLYEGFLGLMAGADLWRLRPSLSAGYGVQSANRREFGFESDAYRLIRETSIPLGLGIRLDLFDRAFVAWEARDRGILMWRFTAGARLARLGKL